MQIYKYELKITDHQIINIARCIKVLSVANQNNALVMYCLIADEEDIIGEIEVCIIGTGNHFEPLDTSWNFRGTHVMWAGKLVWHVWTKQNK